MTNAVLHTWNEARLIQQSHREAITKMQTEAVYRMHTLTWQIIFLRCEVQIDKQFIHSAFTSRSAIASCVFVITAWLNTNA